MKSLVILTVVVVMTFQVLASCAHIVGMQTQSQEVSQ